MKFARRVFAVAGIWGLIVVPPLYFLIDTVGRQYPPPVTHLDFYYGFIAVTLAWQVAFLVIATDPVRYRPLMPAAMVEKFLYVVTMATLFGMGRVQAGQAAVAIPDVVPLAMAKPACASSLAARR
jgi:hypothetical protein